MSVQLDGHQAHDVQRSVFRSSAKNKSRTKKPRIMLNGMLWIIRSGAQWCELLKRSEPAGVPCWKTGPMVPGRFGNISQLPGPGISYAFPPQSNISGP